MITDQRSRPAATSRQQIADGLDRSGPHAFLLWARWDHVFTDWRRMRMGFWLWLPAGLMLVVIALQLAGVDWGKFTGAHLMWIVVAAVLVGFAEETLFRTIILRALREGGRREWVGVLVTACGSGGSTSPTCSSASR